MDFYHLVITKYNYWVSIVLMMLGLYAVVSKNNLIKKIIGLAIFQNSIILFYISISVKHVPDTAVHRADTGRVQAAELGNRRHYATIPILKHIEEPDDAHSAGHADEEQDQGGHHYLIDSTQYANPLPHVLMLTAIVVGVATLGMALALVERIFQKYGSIEEREVLERLE